MRSGPKGIRKQVQHLFSTIKLETQDEAKCCAALCVALPDCNYLLTKRRPCGRELIAGAYNPGIFDGVQKAKAKTVQLIFYIVCLPRGPYCSIFGFTTRFSVQSNFTSSLCITSPYRVVMAGQFLSLVEIRQWLYMTTVWHSIVFSLRSWFASFLYLEAYQSSELGYDKLRKS